MIHIAELIWHLVAHYHAFRICHGPIVSGNFPGHPITIIPPACKP